MPDFSQRILGVNKKAIPFTPVRQPYIPLNQGLLPNDEDEDQQYKGEDIVFYEGLSSPYGSFLATRESNAPLKEQVPS